MRHPPLTILFATLAIMFFATPVALRVVGVTANDFENRKFAAAPSLSQGFDAFDQTTRFLTDRLPLREQAVRANTKISQKLFGTTPSYGAAGGDKALPFAGGVQGAAPTQLGANDDQAQKVTGAARVIDGRDNWLYLRDELTDACTPKLPAEVAVRRWQGVVRLLRSYGKRVVVVVPPDKFSIYPEHLKIDAATRRCAEKGSSRLGSALSHARARDGVVGLRSAVLAAKRRSRGALLYRKRDTHWNQRGGLALVKAVVDTFGGRRVRYSPRDVFRGKPITADGDLTILKGAPQSETAEGLGIHRPKGAPRVRGRTVYVSDSYGNIVPGLVQPYFEHFTQQPWIGLGSERLGGELAAADTVVMVTVERDFSLWVSDQGPVGPAFLRGLRAGLARAHR